MNDKATMETDLKVKVNDIIMNYDDYGKGSIPIIFIHGFPFDKSTWQPQMDHLKANYRVISIDVRGFGKSTSSKEECSITQFADDVIEFMDALDIYKAIICGLSMGGYIAINLACRFPHRFEGIVLADTQCIADTIEIKNKRIQAISKIKSGGIKVFIDDFIKSVFSPEAQESKKELVENIRDIIRSNSTLTITSALMAIAERLEMCTLLKEIPMPVLIICGQSDSLTPPAQSELLHSCIKNSRLEFINNAGHLSNLEQPNDFNAKLGNFILHLNESQDRVHM